MARTRHVGRDNNKGARKGWVCGFFMVDFARLRPLTARGFCGVEERISLRRRDRDLDSGLPQATRDAHAHLRRRWSHSPPR